MIKVTEKLNSPVRIAVFAMISIIIVSAIAFGVVSVGAKAWVNKTIGLEKSYQVALKDAGLAEEQTSNVITKYVTKNGQATYEVSFESGGFRFFYSIKASDGSVLDCNMVSLESETVENQNISEKDEAGSMTSPEDIYDSRDSSAESDPVVSQTGNSSSEHSSDATDDSTVGSGGHTGNTGNTGNVGNTGDTGNVGHADGNVIGGNAGSTDSGAGKGDTGKKPDLAVPNIDVAKAIVLKKIGLDESQVINVSIKPEKDGDNIKYEVDVYVKNGKYECEVDGATGKITELEFEEDDDHGEDSDGKHKKDRGKDDDDDDYDRKKSKND